MKLITSLTFESDNLQQLEEVQKNYLYEFKPLEGLVDPSVKLLVCEVKAEIVV